jgi:uncharacterized damage-inducible protein DinB
MHLIDARSTEIVDTWRLHNRVTVFLLDAIEPEVFRAPDPEVGRSAPAMLAHLHHVRLLWLQSAAPALYKGQEKAPELRRPALRKALTASGKAIETLVIESLATTGKIKGFKPHAVAFVGYLIAHESYHHGEISLALRDAGYPLDRRSAYGLWEWGKR